MKLKFAIFISIAAAVQCGRRGVSPSGTSGSVITNVPHFSHVFVVVEENHSYGDVIGNASMPYLNSLVSGYGLATQYFADAHPSLPNYFELTVGEGTSITGVQGDSYTGVVSQDNVVRALAAAGKSWKSYQGGLPSAGYLGGDTGTYLQHHDPFAYFSDVQNSASQAANIVPFTQFATDLSGGSLPDYSFIVPDVNNDAHDCPVGMSSCSDAQKLAAADQWLSANMGPLVASSAFQNSLLVVLFDEGDLTDLQHFGGQVAAVIVSPQAKAGYQSTTFFEHASTLRLMLKGLGVTDLPGGAATATDMGEFFK
jgi:phosphatidylinositol-3-phosphatase